MADGMTGIERLRRASTQTKFNDCRICEASGIEIDCYEYCNDERGRALAAIADQIEREHAEELASAKRDLADEAREAVERLRMVSHDDILRSVNPEHEIVDELCKAVGVVRQPTYTGTFDAISDRLIELIEHGGKRDADVAALRELADELDKRAHGAYGKTFVNASMYAGLMHGLSKRIRKAVEGATVPDAESDAACAALMEWRDQVAGLLGIDAGSMADEVQDAIMDELDKRLMPPGMEWPPKDSGGEDLSIGDKAHFLRTEHDGDHEWHDVVTAFRHQGIEGEGDVWIVEGEHGEAFACECTKRPEPKVLGADGLPIREGETVWDSTSPNDPTSGTVWRHGGPLKVLRRNDVRVGFVVCENDQGIPLDCLAADLTHAAPDTQERIDEDASVPPRRYYADKIGHDVGLKDDEEVFTAVALDLLRRQRELDAKTAGGAR